MILFLGSGVSLESGLPSVSKIREELLNIDKNSKLFKLLNLLIELDTNYLENSAPFRNKSGRYGFTGQLFRLDTTYEDLFYLVDQIVINGEGLKADITAESFADLVRKKGRTFLRGKTRTEQAVDLHKLAIEARKFIEKKVSTILHTTNVKGIDLILELIRMPHIKDLDIVTLNHDTLVEQFLIKHKIKYSDGFGCSKGDVRWFEDNFPTDSKTRLIKIHGSISWWQQGSGKVLQPVTVTDEFPEKWRTKNGEVISNIRSTPSFLTGVSKVYSYNRGIFADQHFRFLQLLHNNKLMIMSGYGWGDIPINFQLQNWLARNKQNTLLLLHQDPDSLVNNSLELRHIYNHYKNEGQIISIKKWLSEASINDINIFLN